MFAVPDALAAFYLVCFLFGLVFVAISAVLGAGDDLLHMHLPGVHSPFHFGHGGFHGTGAMNGATGHGVQTMHVGGHDHVVGAGHAHAAHAANGTDQSNGSREGASPLNFMTLMAFLTWFGAAGYVLYVYYSVWPVLSLLASVVSGAIAAWLVFLFLAKVLLPGTDTWNPAEHEIVGRLGHVTIAIPGRGIGEVVYTMDGARHSDGAISVNGLPIPKEAEVVIVGYEKGIAQVEVYPR